jgi:3-deoxy-D-manno-octulosonic-acid transferase
MILEMYRALTVAGGPLIDAYLDRRLERGKEEAGRLGERRGIAGRPRPPGRLVWMHGASVGEALSLLPLAERLAGRPGLSVLMTTGTVTSARLLADRLPPGAVHHYVPVDRPAYVRAFLDHWRPDFALWAESDFWPNLLGETHRRGVPVVLVQGRVSPRSFARWRRVPGFIRRVLGNFALCLAQTEEDARRLDMLGAPHVACRGNLKTATPPLACDPAELERLSALVAGRPVWLAASTHPGEEEAAALIHRRLVPTHPGLLTIVAPRHPGRGPAVAEDLAGWGLRVALRSAGATPGAGTDLYVADTMGEMGLFYRLAPIVFMGKSLTVDGGQNPYEPAALGAAVLFGPRMTNFRAMAAAMRAAGAAEEVADIDALAAALARLFAQPDLLDGRRRAAKDWSGAEAGALDAVLAAIDPYLAELGHAGA